MGREGAYNYRRPVVEKETLNKLYIKSYSNTIQMQTRLQNGDINEHV